MPVYGQPIKMAMDSSVNIGLHDQSPYSDKHLHSMNDNMQHLKEMARERYSLSSPDDQAAMDRLNCLMDNPCLPCIDPSRLM